VPTPFEPPTCGSCTPVEAVSFTSSTQAPGQARSFVAARCREAHLTPETCDVLELLVTELVTNAVIHGRSDVGVELSRDSGHLRVAVVDENSRHPVVVDDDPNALDGRGMVLVARLAEAWGVEDRAYGKAVWFALPAA
jgi:anti-sigma regulatory factor (Ser/Thr protein kinase)